MGYSDMMMVRERNLEVSAREKGEETRRYGDDGKGEVTRNMPNKTI